MAEPVLTKPTEEGVSPEEKRAAFHARLEKMGYDKAKINQMESSYKEVKQEINPSVGLGLVGEEYKIPDREVEGTILEDLGSSFYNAFVDLGEGLGNLIPTVAQAVGADNSDGTFWDTWMNGVSGWADNREVRLSDKGSQALSDDFSNLNAWGSALGQGLGFIATMFGGGGALAKGASLAGKSASTINKARKTGQFLSGTLSMTPDLYEQGIEAGLSKANAARMALSISSVVSMTEGVALEWMGKTIAKPVTNKAAKEAMKESLGKFSVKDMTRADFDDAIALTGMKFGDKMKAHGAKAFTSTAIESTQEFSQTYIEEGMKQLYDTIFAEDKKKGDGAYGADVMSWNTFREALAGGLVGGMIGGGLGLGGSLREGIKGETLFYEVNNAVKNNNTAKIDKLKNTIADLNAQGKLKDTPESIFSHIDKITEYTKKTKGLNIPNTAARYQLFQMMDLEKIASEKIQSKFATDEGTHKLVSAAYNQSEKLAGMVSTALNDDMKMIIEEGKTLEKNPEKFESQMRKYADLYKMITLGVVKDEEVLTKLLPKVSYSVKEQVAEQKKAEKEAEQKTTATTTTTQTQPEIKSLSAEDISSIEQEHGVTISGNENEGYSVKSDIGSGDISKITEDTVKEQIRKKGFKIKEEQEVKVITEEEQELIDIDEQEKVQLKNIPKQNRPGEIIKTIPRPLIGGFKMKKISKLIGTKLQEGDTFSTSYHKGGDDGRITHNFEVKDGKIIQNGNDNFNQETDQRSWGDLEVFKYEDFISPENEEKIKQIKFETETKRTEIKEKYKNKQIEQIQNSSVNELQSRLNEIEVEFENADGIKYDKLVNEKGLILKTINSKQDEKSENLNQEKSDEQIEIEKQSEEIKPQETEVLKEEVSEEKVDEDFVDEDEQEERNEATDKTIPGKDVKEQRAVNTTNSANSIASNQALYNKIRNHFRKIFPHIPLTEIDNIAWKFGPQVLARVTELGIDINKDSAMQSSLIHEYAHVYLRVLGLNDPIVKMGLEMIKTTPFMDWAKTNYPHLSTAEQAEEALVEAIAQNSLDKLKLRFEGNQLEKFMAFLKKFWNRVKRFIRQDKTVDIVAIIADGMTFRKMPVAKNNTMLAGLNADNIRVVDPKIVETVRLINGPMLQLGLDAVIDKYGKTDITKKGFEDVTYSALVKQYLTEKGNTLNDNALRIFNGIENADIKTTFEEGKFAEANGLLKGEIQSKNPEMFTVIENSIQSIANKNKSTKNNNNKDEMDSDLGETEAKSNNAVKAVKGPSKSVRSIIGSILDSSGQLVNTNKIFQYITSISNDSMSPDAFINQLMMDASTRMNSEADALYNVLAGMNEETRLGVLTELNSLVATPYWSTNITTVPGKIDEETGKQGEPVAQVRDQPVNVDAIVKDEFSQAVRRVDNSNNEQAIGLLVELLNDNSEYEGTLLAQPSENTYNRIKQILDIVLEQNLDINAVKKFVDDLNKKGDKKLFYWFDSKYESLLNILKHKEYVAKDGKTKKYSLNNYDSYLKGLMTESKGRKEVQTNFVNKAGNRVSAIKPGDWISQFRKLLINSTKYIKDLLSNNVYANNPVLKFWKDNNNVDYYIHDAISNAVKNKANDYSEQSVSDTNILGLQRFVNNVSSKFYYQNIGVTADRDHSTWFKVPRIANADLKKACAERAKIEQELYDKKVKANPNNRANIDNFFNKLSINKIVDGKVVPYGSENYPKEAQSKIDAQKAALLKDVRKFGVDKAILENNKEYKTTDELLEAYVVNDAINRQWLMDMIVGPAINLKDVPDVMKRMGGANSGVKQFPLDKPVHVFVINSIDKNGKINSDSFSFNGSNLHNELARLSGPTDKVGANMKDQLFQVNPDGQLNYFKMSTIGDYGNALRNMGDGYIEMSDALRAIEEQLGGDAYVKIIDKKAIKGPMEGYNVIELNDFLSTSKSDIKGLVAKGHSMEFNNYGAAFNLNKDLSKVPLNEQNSILSTQTAKIILNGATAEELQQFESNIVNMLKRALGIKGDDYSYKGKTVEKLNEEDGLKYDKYYPTTYGGLLDPVLLSTALTKNIDEEEKNLISKILFEVNKINSEHTIKVENGKKTKVYTNNPIRSFDHPNLVNAVQQFLSTKLTKTGIKVEIAGNYLQMVPNYGSGLQWYKHDDNYNLQKPAEVALPWSMFAKSKEEAEAMLKSNPDAFRVVVVRVPASAPVSEFVATVKYFTDENTNAAVLPDQFMHTSDADHDGDKTFVYRQELDENGKVLKDSNKTKIFEMMYKSMSSPYQVKETMTNDLGLESLKENLRRLGFNNVDSFSLSDFQGMANIQDTMSFGADAIGIMAIASKMLSVLSQSGEQLKQPLAFGYDNEIGQLVSTDESLQKFTDKSINNIAKLLQAALDLAKDPLLSNTGINKHTVNVATTLVLLGKDIEEISGFLNDPVIKDMVRELDNNNSSFNPEKSKSVFEIAKQYRSKFSPKTNIRIETVEKLQERLDSDSPRFVMSGENFKKHKADDIYEAKGKEGEDSIFYKLVNPAPNKNNPTITEFEIEIVSDLEGTPAIIKKFAEISNIANNIKTLIPIIQLDKQLPNNATELKRLTQTIEEVTKGELGLTTSKFMERPLIKHYIAVSKLLQNLISRKFVTEKQEMYDIAGELAGTFFGLDSKKVMDETLYQYVSQELMKGEVNDPAKMIDELINLIGNLNTENVIVEVEEFDEDKNESFNNDMQSSLSHESIEKKDKAMDNMVEQYGEDAVNQYMEVINNKAKYEHLKDNKFLKYISVTDVKGVLKITPKRDAFQFESDGVKDEIRKSFEELPQDLQNMLINYQMLKDGINDKIGSLMEMLPQHYSLDLLHKMSGILNRSAEYFEQNKELLKKNAVLKFKDSLPSDNLAYIKNGVVEKDGTVTLKSNGKFAPPYAFVKGGKVYVSENGKYVPMENENFQSGKGWVKMSKNVSVKEEVVAPIVEEIQPEIIEQQPEVISEPQIIEQPESVVSEPEGKLGEQSTNTFKYFGGNYTIVLDASGKGIDVVGYKGKQGAKQKVLDAYNTNPDVDPQNGKQFRNFKETKKEEIISDKPKFVPKNTEQSKAIELMQEFIQNGDSSKWFTLEGKAGTGKTTLVQEVLSKFPDKRIIISAVAHKAKKVLYNKIREYADNLRVSPHSVAGMLGMTMNQETGKFEVPKNEFSDKPIQNANIIVIDEASMLNEEAVKLIMDNKNKKAKVIFLGDPGQLPPIREKSSDVISPVFNTENKYGLRERVRQGEESPILPFADNFWTDSEQLPTSKNPMVSKLSDKGNLVFVKDFPAIKEFVVNQFKQAVAEKNPNKIKIVAYRNDTRKKTNQYIRNQVFNNPVEEFLPGEILMFNNQFVTRDKEIIENAEEVVILDSSNDTYQFGTTTLKTKNIEFVDPNDESNVIEVQVVKEESKAEFNRIVDNMRQAALNERDPKSRSRRWVSYYNFKDKTFADLDYAYAITSHKSQGSTYETVMVNAEDISSVGPISKITKARSIYTAITRASKTVIVYSTNMPTQATAEQMNELNNLPNNDDINEVKKCF